MRADCFASPQPLVETLVAFASLQLRTAAARALIEPFARQSEGYRHRMRMNESRDHPAQPEESRDAYRASRVFTVFAAICFAGATWYGCEAVRETFLTGTRSLFPPEPGVLKAAGRAAIYALSTMFLTWSTVVDHRWTHDDGNLD